MTHNGVPTENKAKPYKGWMIISLLLSVASLLLPMYAALTGVLLAVAALVFSLKHKKATGKRPIGFWLAVFLLIVQSLILIGDKATDGKSLQGTWKVKESIDGVRQKVSLGEDGTFEWVIQSGDEEIRVEARFETKFENFGDDDWETYSIILKEVDTNGVAIPGFGTTKNGAWEIRLKVKDDKAILLDTKGNDFIELVR